MFCVSQAKEKHKIDLTWDRDVAQALADGYDVNYGARSIKYEVERRVVNQLAAAHENGYIGHGCSVQVLTQLSDEKPDQSKIKLRVKKHGVKNFVDIAERETVEGKAKNVHLLF